MSLFKRCSCEGGRCGHPWWYRFRLNRRNYRATTQTTLKRQAADMEAREQFRILEGRHGIRRQPDVAFQISRRTISTSHKATRLTAPTVATARSSRCSRASLVVSCSRNDGAPDRAVQARTAGGEVAGPRADEGRQSRIQPATVNRELDTLPSCRRRSNGEAPGLPGAAVKRLKVDNRRTRILTDHEQGAAEPPPVRSWGAIVDAGADYGRAHWRAAGAGVGPGRTGN